MRVHILTGLILLCSLASPASSQTNTNPFQAKVHLWLSAFIPKSHPAAPDLINRTSKNTFVIKAPDFVGSLAGTCFTTDNRTFDTSPDAPSRLSVNLVLSIDGKEMLVGPDTPRPMARVGLTHNVNCQTGEDLQPPRQAPVERIKINSVVKSNFARVFYIDAAGANPFYPAAKVPGLNMHLGLSPDIDFKISVRYEFLARRIVINGTAGYFPSFEGYYRINNKPTKILYQIEPHEDSTPWSLPDFALGINTRNISAVIDLK